MNRPEIEEPASIMTVRQRPNRAESASIDFDELENMLNDMSNSISMVSSASNRLVISSILDRGKKNYKFADINFYE